MISKSSFPPRNYAQVLVVASFLLGFVFTPAQAQPAGDLITTENVTLIPTDWADGDSFRVRFPDGAEHTVRLYGADCMEWHVIDDSDARRLRAQRRYFGISGYGDEATDSITLAKSIGEEAGKMVREKLSRPFRIHTAFADARGDARYSRIYAFVTTADGEDLASLLVTQGLARAFGVYRSTPDGLSRGDYEGQLRDAELLAARNGSGAWAFTDWNDVTHQRRDQRLEDAEVQLAIGNLAPDEPLDVNAAALSELMRIPGIGEVTANSIIESRPYGAVEDLLRVRGIGSSTLEKIRPYLTIVTPKK